MPPIRLLRGLSAGLLIVLATASAAFATAPGNGRLQIIHLDVGQGDGAVLISPLGQVALFDAGPGGTGALGKTILQQLQALGVTSIEHSFNSHYHSDHLGGLPSIVNGGIPIANGWDRGGSYTTAAYNNYVAALGTHRKTIVRGQVITLDSLSAHPVYLRCIDLNGDSLYTISSQDENTLSVQIKVSYGEFDETFGGDTPGTTNGTYKDIETPESSKVGGHVEVYKVHHHGSATSSLDTWLNATTPSVAVISCGNGNSYGHPTAAALTRLHNHGVKTYWTETGTGVAPLAGSDKVSNGQVVISAAWEGAGVDTIRGTGFTDTFINSGTAPGDGVAPLAALLAPSGGEDLKAGSTKTITWTATDNVGVTSVDLAYSVDGGASFANIATGLANTGSYGWTVPSTATTNGRVRVRARDAAGNVGADSSLTSFTIDFWTVAASAGSGGGISPAGVVNVVQGANASFSITPTAGFAVQDVVVDGGSVGAQANWQFSSVAANHTIAASFLDITAPVVALTSPLGGEAQSFAPGDVCSITWNASDNVGVDSVDVDVALDGLAGGWTALAHGLANSGSWSWTVPDHSTDSARVRVSVRDGAGNAAAAMSDSAFAIGNSSAGVDDGRPLPLALSAPWPNPAHDVVGLHFSLPASADVTLDVMDLQGRRVAQHAAAYGPGAHAWLWDGRDASGSHVQAGMYLVRMNTAMGSRVRRLVLVP